MAASILTSCGRVAAFKTTVLQVWGLRSLPSAVFLCTKPGNSKKGSNKNEGEIINNTKADANVKLADEDLRKFLARKTLVTFPQRAKLSPLEGEPAFSSKEGLTKKLAEEESSTSSSSDSDSSSDSEEDVFKEPIKTKVSFPKQDHISSKDQITKINKVSQKDFPKEQVKGKKSEKLPYSPRITEMPIKQKQLHKTTADDKLLKSNLTDDTDQKSRERHLKSSEFGTKIIKSQRPKEVARKQLEVSVVETASNTFSRTQTVPQQGVVQNLTLLKKKEGMAKKAQKTEEHGGAAAVLQEEILSSRMPVADPTVKEEMVLDVEVQTEQSTIQETKPPVDTVQETYDISTYKNLQHHEYTPYTFVDFDVLLSKMRLPQPSSGRLSSRH
ncbi:NADH dehydrogenase [ubiquinone] flavoprotein 3, mitochondrial [Pogona vitticeps]